MSIKNISWSKKDKEAARSLYETAKKRDYQKLILSIRNFSFEIDENIWELKEFLDAKAKEFDAKYDYRYSMLPLLLALYIEEGLLNINDLEVFSAKIKNHILDTLNFRTTINKIAQNDKDM